MSVPEASATPRLGPGASPVPADVSAVVWDFGNVLLEWDPVPPVAAVFGEQEAARFFAEFDFGAWNEACDAGRSWPDALAELEREQPEWLPYGRAYVENFPLSLRGEIPGSHALVRELAAAGFPQFGLTNWSHELYPHAPATFEVIGLLDDVIVSGTEGLAKPDPAIYRLLPERTGFDLDRLAFVDDRADNVAAAAALGVHAIRFTDADDVRRRLRDLGVPLAQG
ncbi:MAG: HAD family phosphatase [Nocardioides sp.]|uniref:HAD family hydrolase n=1 Tax=Nocardioides sp. TaxID=35761 RepID=UPI0039E4EE01